MKKFFLILFLTPLFSFSIAQTTNVQLYSSDSLQIDKVFKTIKTPSGYKNFYFQIFDYNFNQFQDTRNGMVYRLVGGKIVSNSHNGILMNGYSINGFGLDFTYITDLKFSNNDTNLIFYSRKEAWWEPTARLLLTSNNGSNSVTLALSTFLDPLSGLDVFAKNDSLMIYVYDKKVYKSTNRGNSFTRIDSSALFGNSTEFNKFLSINHLNPQYVFGYSNSNLFLSTTGGTNFQINISNIGYIKSFEYNETEQSIYLLANKLYKSSNNGLNWNIIYDSTLNTIELDPENNNIIWAGNSKGLLKSTNGGVNFILYNNGFLPSQNVVGILKNSNYGDTLIVATSKGVYKVSRPEVFNINLNNASYFPLHIGNRYVYRIGFSTGTLSITQRRIIDTSTINGKKFFRFSPDYLNFDGIQWVRYDSLSSKIIGIKEFNNCQFGNEFVIDSLNSSINDTVKYCENYWSLYGQSSFISNELGNNINYKRFSYIRFLYPQFFQESLYFKNFGLGSSYVYASGDFASYSLKGAIVNGVLYGDTSYYQTSFSVSGSVSYSDDNSPVTSGKIRLLKYNYVNGLITQKDSININSSGNFTFNNISPDTLRVLAVPSDESNPNFVPTFYPSTLDWHSATKIYPNTNLSGIALKVKRINNINNQVSLSGKTIRVSSTNIQTPLNNAYVIVKNGNNYLGYRYSDAYGLFGFTGLQSGLNTIIAYKIGYSSDSITISTTSGNNYENIVLKLRPEYVLNISKNENIIPNTFELMQNFPNPFNPITKISFDIPYKSFTILNIYDINGRLVKSLVNRELTPGRYTIDWDASSNSSGVYFMKLDFDNSSSVKKMVLIK